MDVLFIDAQPKNQKLGAYGKCPKNLNTLFQAVWTKFNFLCSYFLKYLVKWQTV